MITQEPFTHSPMRAPKVAEPVAPMTDSSAVPGGLTSEEAATRLAQFGPNDPDPAKRRSAVLEFLRLFLNPHVLILTMAAVVSIFLGEVTEVISLI